MTQALFDRLDERSDTPRPGELAAESPFYLRWLPNDIRSIIPTPLMLAVVLTVMIMPLDFGSVFGLGVPNGSLSNRGWALRVLMAGGPLLFLLNDPGKAFERMSRHPIVGFTLALTWSVLTIPWSIEPTLSLVAAVSYAGTLMWVVTAVDRAGWEAFERAVTAGLLLFVTAATATDILGIGVVDNPGIASIDFGRLKGVALHPNTLGAASAILVLMSLATIERKRAVPWLPILGLPVGAIALLWTQSRTALLGLLIAIAFVLTPRVLRGFLIIAMFGVLVFIAAFGGFESQTWADLSRSPENSAEVSGLSGRPELWGETIRVIEARPVAGYGIGTAPEVYRDSGITERIGWEPPDAHNEYLQSTVTMGFVGLFFVLWSLIGYWKSTRARPDKWRDGAVVLVLAGSITESVLLGFLPSITFVIMVAALTSASNPKEPVRS